jgi:hypothetical protein
MQRYWVLFSQSLTIGTAGGGNDEPTLNLAMAAQQITAD